MGSDLPKGPPDKAPTFLVAAMRDPFSGNLDRIQIVKGWLDDSGQSHEKVFDVAWSGDRKPGENGKLPPVGNTVDAERAIWTSFRRCRLPLSCCARKFGRAASFHPPQWTRQLAPYAIGGLAAFWSSNVCPRFDGAGNTLNTPDPPE